MKFCSKCGAQCDDNAVFCASCGNNLGAQNQSAADNAAANANANANAAPAPAPAVNYDHTAEFDAKDVSEGKIYAILCYLMGFIGIIIALLVSNKSDYLRFHVRQAAKLAITQTILGICTAILVWTIIVPLAGIVCMGIVFVLQIIAFFQVCAGKSKEPAIIREFPFYN